MTTLAQAVADLIAAPRPILFLDACTLLDIGTTYKSMNRVIYKKAL